MRDVQIVTGLSSGSSVTLEVCSRYIHSLGYGSSAYTVDAGGNISTTLEPSMPEECVCATFPDGSKKIFWVYAGDSVQGVDLTQRVYPRNRVEAIEHADDRTAGMNAEKVMRDVACGRTVVNEEDQRLMCRFGDHVNGEADTEMCRVDHAMMKI